MTALETAKNQRARWDVAVHDRDSEFDLNLRCTQARWEDRQRQLQYAWGGGNDVRRGETGILPAFGTLATRAVTRELHDDVRHSGKPEDSLMDYGVLQRRRLPSLRHRRPFELLVQPLPSQLRTVSWTCTQASERDLERGQTEPLSQEDVYC